MNDDAVVIYWDFENIHASVLDASHERGYYRKNQFSKQEPVVDLGAIVAFAAGIGRVAINRAYGNWQWMSEYRHALHQNAMDLVQMFPLGHSGKNGADIRLAIDVVEDLSRYSGIGHLVLVTGDSDFVGLAQNVRRRGCQVVGVGVQAATNSMWVAACDQFMYYHSLLARRGAAPTEAEEIADVTQAKRLVVGAVRQLAPGSATAPWVVKAAIKPMMQRLDPTFNEAEYGFRSISDLLDASNDVLEGRTGQHDLEYRLREVSEPEISAAIAPEHEYERILIRQQGWRMPDRAALWNVLDAIGQLVTSQAIHGFADLDERVVELLAAQGLAVAALDAKKARQVAFKCRLFRVGADGEVQLMVAPEAIRREIVMGAVGRIHEQNTDEDIDLDALGQLLFGEPTDADRQLISQCVDAVRLGSGTTL